ncbi:MAG: prepilin-type N-terminal cleavage/methylation domain-containing protein [Clostridia bacterium]|nr:prepilin-type N-terminal cleavage/methylation domain-containing protein [Clostridia bacterium]
MKRFWQKEKGFTLIELLIVVAIIGIVAGIAIPRFLGARTTARVTRAFADMRTIADGLEMYFTDENKYPVLGEGETLADVADLKKYITSIPEDPFDAGDGPYRYYVNDATTPSAWLIVSNGPDLEEDVTDATEGFSMADADLIAGELGGPNGVNPTGEETYYGIGAGVAGWSLATSATDKGDIGRGGP